MNTDNIILIGMPGCGKSTVGVVLAKALQYDFTDTDIVIQRKQNKRLHEIIAEVGDSGFRKLENEITSQMTAHHQVIATGGSVIYGRDAMENLKKLGTVVYLQLSFEDIEERLGDFSTRGITMLPGQTLHDLYNERIPMYEQYADLTIDCSEKRIRHIVLELREKMGL